MLCPECQGMGTTGCWDEEHKCFVELECKRCHGTGDTVGTNQEWLDSLPTKEKADWLFKLTYKCYWCGREYTARSKSLYNEKACPFKKCMQDKKAFEKWLKEEHHDNTD